MNHKLFENNLKLLSENNPQTAQQIKTLISGANPVISVRTEISRSGHNIMVIEKNGKNLPIHSRINPVREAFNLVKKRIKRIEDSIFIIGLELGYLPEAIVEDTSIDATVYIYEPIVEIMKFTFENIDLSRILTNPNIRFIFTKDIDDSLFDQRVPVNPTLIYLSSYKRAFKDEVEKFERSFNNFFQKTLINKATLKRFDRLWTRNSFKNIEYFFRAPGVSNLAGAGAGTAAIVIAAGPSIEDNIKDIKRLSIEGNIIISVDTATIPLIKHNIIPDFIVSVDPQLINSLSLNPIFFNNIPGDKMPILVCDPGIYPSALRNYPGKVLITSSVFPPGKFIEKYSGEKGYIAAGGSVSVSAFDLARILKVDPIIIIGLDLSYIKGRTHIKGSFVDYYRLLKSHKFRSIQNHVTEYLSGGSPFKLKNNRDEICYTDKRMMLYKQWFEKNIQTTSQRVINSTSRGLFIEGVETLNLSKITGIGNREKKQSLLNYVKSIFLNNKNGNSILEGSNHSPAHPIKIGINKEKAIRKNTEKFIQRLEEIEANIKNIKDKARSALELIDYDEKANSKPSLKTLKKLDEIDVFILSLKEEVQLISMAMQGTVFEIMGRNTEKGTGNILSNSRKLYGSIEESCSFLLNIINLAKNRLKFINSIPDN